MIVIAGRGMDKIKADAQEKGDLGLVAEVGNDCYVLHKVNTMSS